MDKRSKRRLSMVAGLVLCTAAYAALTQQSFEADLSYTWDVPTTRENGEPITTDELDHYTIFVKDLAGLSPAYTQYKVVGGATKAAQLVYTVKVTKEDALDDGMVKVTTYMTATDESEFVDDDGVLKPITLESKPSEEVVADVEVPAYIMNGFLPSSPPSAVQEFNITVEARVRIESTGATEEMREAVSGAVIQQAIRQRP